MGQLAGKETQVVLGTRDAKKDLERVNSESGISEKHPKVIIFVTRFLRVALFLFNVVSNNRIISLTFMA